MTRAVAIGAVRRSTVAISRFLMPASTIGSAALILLVAFSAEAAAASGTGPPRSASAEEAPAPPPQIRELMSLLADPKVRDWLEKSRAAELAAARAPNAETD